MTVRAVVQARMSSSRLRGKTLMPVHGVPLLARLFSRLEAMTFVDEVVVATSRLLADEPIAAFTESRGYGCIRGHPEDVLDRYAEACAGLSPQDHVLRLTADNPFYDAERAAKVWERHSAEAWEYTLIEGLCHAIPEFLRVDALQRCAELARTQFEREHVTPYLRDHADDFRILSLPGGFEGLRPDLDLKITVDTPVDLERCERMLAEIEEWPTLVSLDEVYAWLDREEGSQRG